MFVPDISFLFQCVPQESDVFRTNILLQKELHNLKSYLILILAVVKLKVSVVNNLLQYNDLKLSDR